MTQTFVKDSNNTADASWAGLLQPDEHIVWQGAPDHSWHIGFGGMAMAAFGIFFAGFAVFWMTMASQAGGAFWMFGLIHFAAGIGIIFGGLVYPTYRRRHTFYSLTNKNAFIATDMPIVGRKLKSYPITASTPLDFTPGPLATIHFATETRRTKNGSKQVPIGFERIPDGAAVYTTIRDLQMAG